jgi:hypothetical protein
VLRWQARWAEILSSTAFSEALLSTIWLLSTPCPWQEEPPSGGLTAGCFPNPGMLFPLEFSTRGHSTAVKLIADLIFGYSLFEVNKKIVVGYLYISTRGARRPVNLAWPVAWLAQAPPSDLLPGLQVEFSGD